jgi:radical SAM protein with 4Fe4S-binding SPASM domain
MNGDIYIPDSVVLELTYRCNHRCLFCSCPWEADTEGYPKYEKNEELTVEQWKQALDILGEYGVKYISISGGEALLKEGLIDILAYIRQKNIFNRGRRIVLISNGLAMNKNFLAAFKQYNIHLSLSLPGLSTFEKHTGTDNAGGVLYWLRETKKESVETTVNVTVTKLNYHELFETIANGLIAGADTLLLNRFLIGGRGIAYKNELSLNRSQLNGMLDIAEDILRKSNRPGSVGTEFPLCIISKPVDYYKRLNIGSICAAGKNFFVIDPSGYIRVCNHSPRKTGHIFNPDIINDRAYWNRFVQRNYIPEGCIRCKDVSYCDCGCRETAAIVCGSLTAKDPCLNDDFEDAPCRDRETTKSPFLPENNRDNGE